MNTILVVETDPRSRQEIASAFGDDDHVLAFDGYEAASDAVHAVVPDLVVCSTGGRGHDVSRLVRVLHGDKVAVLLLGSPGEVQGEAFADADDVVLRPLALQGLRARSARLLRQVRLRAAV